MSKYFAWIVPVLPFIVTVLVTVITCRWQLRTELRKILENYVSDKKYKAYYNAVNLFYTVVSENKMNGTMPAPSDIVQEMLKVKEDLFVYGSDEAFRAFTEFLCCSTANYQSVELFKPFLNFMLIVRKEISGGKSTITTDDILLNIMQSRDEIRKYHEAINKTE